jgi:hypothetical protein
MATRVGKVVRKAMKERKRKAQRAKAEKALKTAAKALAVLAAAAGVAVGARTAVKLQKMTPAQRRAALAKVRRAVKKK